MFSSRGLFVEFALCVSRRQVIDGAGSRNGASRLRLIRAASSSCSWMIAENSQLSWIPLSLSAPRRDLERDEIASAHLGAEFTYLQISFSLLCSCVSLDLGPARSLNIDLVEC